MNVSPTLLLLLILSIGCKEPKETQQLPLNTSMAMCAPVASDKEWYLTDNEAPLFEGLGDLNFPVSTQNELVQRYINQGLVLAYGFNHAEAARSFYYATKLDPDCAMAYWGYAYVLGPNYNAGMESDNYERAYDAIQKALERSKRNGTEKEKELIAALAKRYVRDPIEDRSQLDADYSKSMGDLFQKYPEDADIGTLYAESLMNLHPWDLYDTSGEVKAWTPEILSVLETVLDHHPNHCGAHHFYIHAVEASPNPEKGLRSAQKFDDGLVPNAGHLVHMASHIYIRTGDYHKGTLANINAIRADSMYVNACNAQGVYPLAYFPHNQHFMAGTATLEGNSKWAIYAADEVAKNANRQLMKEAGWGTLQHYYTIPFYVYVKFGKWDDILEMKNDVPDLDYPTALLHYAKGMAYVGKGKLKQAKKELAFLSSISSREELKKVTIWDINSVYELVQIAEKVLRAEILAAEKQHAQSIELLKEAIEIEDNLNYNEPPDWFFSVRHILGAILLEAGENEEAIKIYQADLKRLPKNGWALKGLVIAYSNMNKLSEAKILEEQFNKAWLTADVELLSSVIR
jgi:tetratricopeptide (TPR) repeat protein